MATTRANELELSTGYDYITHAHEVIVLGCREMNHGDGPQP